MKPVYLVIGTILLIGNGIAYTALDNPSSLVSLGIILGCMLAILGMILPDEEVWGDEE